MLKESLEKKKCVVDTECLELSKTLELFDRLDTWNEYLQSFKSKVP